MIGAQMRTIKIGVQILPDSSMVETPMRKPKKQYNFYSIFVFHR
jgi:hypothetical protein